MENKYINATIRGKTFLLPIDHVLSIQSVPVFPVPLAPATIYGIIFYNDNAVAVLDPFGETSEPPALQIVYKKAQHITAYAADTVDAVVSLTQEEISSLQTKNTGESDILQL